MQVSKVLVVDGDGCARDALVTCLKFVGVEAHGAETVSAARSWLTTGVADVVVLSDEVIDDAHPHLMAHWAGPADARASILVLTRSIHPRSLTNYPGNDTLRRPIAVSRVVERVESMIHERALMRGVTLRFGILSLELAAGRAVVGESSVLLGHTEARVLAFFIGAPDKVFSRVQLLQRIWPATVRVEERTVDVHIRRLRLSLATLGCAGYIQTVRGSGYRFSSF